MVKIEPVTAPTAHILMAAIALLALLVVDGKFEQDHSCPLCDDVSELVDGVGVNSLAHELDAEIENVLVSLLHIAILVEVLLELHLVSDTAEHFVHLKNELFAVFSELEEVGVGSSDHLRVF
jgi:hypothetical protein